MSEYTQEQLNEAFQELLKKRQHWKDPIDRTIFKPGKAKQALLTEACIHFTGSVPDFLPAPGGRVRVVAAGYYATIGA